MVPPKNALQKEFKKKKNRDAVAEPVQGGRAHGKRGKMRRKKRIDKSLFYMPVAARSARSATAATAATAAATLVG